MRTMIILTMIVVSMMGIYGGVVDLTPDNFDSIVDGSKSVFVEFFAPWCGHCKSLAPAYEEVGEAFSKISEVVIAKVDADQHKDLGGRFGVSGFPTLKFFKKGSKDSPSDYNGGRDANDIIEFINREAGTHARVSKPASSVKILNPDNFDSHVLDEAKHAFVEFYAPWCGHCKKLAPTWEKLANVFKNEEDIVIANVDADQFRDLGTKYDVSGFPTLVYFSKDNKKGERYNGGRELADLVTHVNLNAGTHRHESGSYDDKHGRHDILDALAKKFMAATGADRDSIAKEAAAEATKLGNKIYDWYGKFMNLVIKRGEDFLKKEAARVKSMLDGGSVESHKVDEFTIRKNVLNAFESSTESS